MYNSTKAKQNSHAVRWCTSHTTFGVSMERVFGVTVAAMREDDTEEIVDVIEENLKKDAKDDVSEEEEIPLKEEENLNKSSDEEMYLWDEIEYKTNYV